MHAEALSEPAEISSSLYHLGGVFWYGSSISIIIYLSLIRGISSVADGENVCFKLALKQGFSALVTVISLIYSAVCVAGSCLDLQQRAVESRILLLWQFPSSTGLLLVFRRRNAPATMWLSLPTRVLCVLWLVLARIFSS